MNEDESNVLNTENISSDSNSEINLGDLETARSKIDNAWNNAISTERFSQINNRLNEILDIRLKYGIKRDREQDTLFDEIYNSTAIAHNHDEFHMLLKSLTQKTGGSIDFDELWFNHEYQHYTESENKGYKNIKYGITFIMNEEGGMSAIPRVITENIDDWSPEEFITKILNTIKAAEDPSPDDIQDKIRLEKILSGIKHIKRTGKYIPPNIKI